MDFLLNAMASPEKGGSEGEIKRGMEKVRKRAGKEVMPELVGEKGLI